MQNLAADANLAKTFDDVERVIDPHHCPTRSGLSVILEPVEELKRQLGSQTAQN